jgi:hypothetical protein
VINMGYTFVNNTSRAETYPVYCTVLDCGELLAHITLLAHTAVIVPEATCKVPRIMERHVPNEESGHG